MLYPTPCKSAGILQDKIFIVFGPFADYIGCRSTAYPIERTFKAIAGISHIVQLLMFKHIWSQRIIKINESESTRYSLGLSNSLHFTCRSLTGILAINIAILILLYFLEQSNSEIKKLRQSLQE